MTEESGTDLDALGLEPSEDAGAFTVTAGETAVGIALGVAGLAAVVVLGAAAVVGFQAASWLWPLLLFSLGGS